MKRLSNTEAKMPRKRDAVFVTADYIVADCPYCVEGYIRQAPYGRLHPCPVCDGTGSTLTLAPPVSCDDIVRKTYEAPKLTKITRTLDWPDWPAVIGLAMFAAGALLLVLWGIDWWKGIR